MITVPSHLISIPAQTQSNGNQQTWQGIEPKTFATFPLRRTEIARKWRI